MAETQAPGALGSFERDTTVRLLQAEGERLTFAGEVSPGWQAGRGPHGGYLAAMMLRALQETVADPARAPRSLTVHYARAPEPGPVVIEAVTERRGRSLSTLSGRMEQDGRLVALVLAAFSVPWSGPELDDMAMPAVAPPDPPAQREPPELPEADPLVPQFGRHITLQPRIGGRPFADSSQPMEVGGWIGHAEQRPIDALSMVFFLDALMPAPFMRMSAPNAAPTIDLTVHFRAALEQPGERLCLARTRCRLIHEGFFEEDGVIWSSDGRVLAQSRQLALLLPFG